MYFLMPVFVTFAIAIMSKDNALCVKCIMRILKDASKGKLSTQRTSTFYRLCSIVGPTKFTTHSIRLMMEFVNGSDIDDADLELMGTINTDAHIKPSSIIPRMERIQNVLYLTKLTCFGEIFDKLFIELLDMHKAEKEGFLDNMSAYNKISNKKQFMQYFRHYLTKRLEHGCYYGIEPAIAFAKELDIWCKTKCLDIFKDHGLQHYYASIDMESGTGRAVYIAGLYRTRVAELFKNL
jgi:hypothetical protein